MTVKEQVKQAFLAQAVADAFCYPYEFRTPALSAVTEDYFGGRPISISDDTQMAMFGLYALGAARRALREDRSLPLGASPIEFVRASYVAWYRTQVGSRMPEHGWNCWLEREPKMRRPRAPGNTCMSACRALMHDELVQNDSMGNGAVMRTLPFVFAPDIVVVNHESALKLALSAGALTHKHPDSFAAVNQYMLHARHLRSVGHLTNFAGVFNLDGNTFTALPALNWAVTGLNDALQEGMSEERFCRMLTHFAIANIDSDTVAAIAGGLYGLVHAAPQHLIERLVERDVIEKLVEWACP